MKILTMVAIGILTLSISANAQEKQATDEHRTVTQVLDHAVSNLERDFVPAAEAMPADKYAFAPTNGEFKGVRTFAQQIKHVATVNYMFGGAILGEKPPIDTRDEEGPASMTSKPEIIKYLKDSFAYVHKAVATVNENNLVEPLKSPFGVSTVTRLGLSSSIAPHGFDHYGQMVEYLRMNGIIPPA